MFELECKTLGCLTPSSRSEEREREGVGESVWEREREGGEGGSEWRKKKRVDG